MKFALFYEIPVARPWTPGKEHQAYKDTIEQAMLGDKMGFHSFWTVEHHFLEEYSHCSNPEVLYGAIAARTENIRIGYGVRLLPEAVQPPDPHRGVGRGARPHLRRPRRVRHRPLVDARRARGLRRRSRRDARDVARGARAHRRRVDRGRVPGRRASTGRWARRGACYPKPLQQPHPPIFGATSSLPGHEEIGQRGIGLCSFTVGLPPEQLADNIAMYREGPRRVRAARGQVRQRHRGHVHDGALRADERRGHRGRRASRSSGTRSTAAG